MSLIFQTRQCAIEPSGSIKQILPTHEDNIQISYMEMAGPLPPAGLCGSRMKFAPRRSDLITDNRQPVLSGWARRLGGEIVAERCRLPRNRLSFEAALSSFVSIPPRQSLKTQAARLCAGLGR